MPEMTPVGNTIIPPNPMTGINTLSGILGIQQQQQQLRSETAAATIAQQSATENQNLAQVLTDPVKAGITYADGTPTPGAFARFQALAPTSGAERYKQWIDAAKAKVGFQSDVTALSNAQRGQIGSVLSAGTAGNVSRSQTVEDLTQLGQDNPSAWPVIAHAIAYLPAEPHLTGNDQLDSPAKAKYQQKLNDYRNNFGRSVLAPADVALINMPITGTTIDATGRQVGTAQSKTTGAYGPAGGPGIVPGVPPQIVAGPSGIPTVVKGSSASAAAGAGAGQGPTPTSTDWEQFGSYNANLNARVAIASDAIPRIRAAEQALDQMKAGGGAGGYVSLAKRLQAIPGMPQSIIDAVGAGNLAAAQEAEKLLFQTTFSGLRQSMQGDPARVAEFQSAEQVFPSIGTDPRATKTILKFMTDQGQRDYAEQQALVNARKSGTFNPATWQADYQEKLRGGKVPGVPQSQVPSGPRALTPERFTTYAKKYFDGDEAKAKAFLASQGVK
jgi:hypothetical protein